MSGTISTFVVDPKLWQSTGLANLSLSRQKAKLALSGQDPSGERHIIGFVRDPEYTIEHAQCCSTSHMYEVSFKTEACLWLRGHTTLHCQCSDSYITRDTSCLTHYMLHIRIFKLLICSFPSLNCINPLIYANIDTLTP